MPTVGSQLEPFARQVPDAHALEQVGRLVLQRAGLLPAAFELTQTGVHVAMVAAGQLASQPVGPAILEVVMVIHRTRRRTDRSRERAQATRGWRRSSCGDRPEI